MSTGTIHTGTSIISLELVRDWIRAGKCVKAKSNSRGDMARLISIRPTLGPQRAAWAIERVTGHGTEISLYSNTREARRAF